MTTFDPETGILYDGRYSLDKQLIETICNTFAPTALVADLGCGREDYCRVLEDNGYEVDGYEGNPLACRNAVCNSIECVDLTKPIEPKKEYDLVL